MAAPWLLDTNVLLRFVQSNSPEYKAIRLAIDRVRELTEDIYYTSQNLSEFWNVCTRPTLRNGFGYSIFETDKHALTIETQF